MKLRNLVIILAIAAVLMVGCAGLMQKAEQGIDAAEALCNWFVGTFDNNADLWGALEDWLNKGGTVPEALVTIRYTENRDDAAKVLRLVMDGKAFVPVYEDEQIPWPVWMISPDSKGVPWSEPPGVDPEGDTIQDTIP
jgi:hypothetical protein